MFGPQLTNLQTVSLSHLPYLLEVLLVMASSCPRITGLEVGPDALNW